MPSDIHVFVRFRDQCVFAGEELSCTITFKNVADLPEPPASATGAGKTRRQGSISKLAAQSARNAVAARGLPNSRPSISGSLINEPAVRSIAVAPVKDSPSASAEANRNERPGHKQQRSLSIISVNAAGIAQDSNENNLISKPSKRQPLTHRRSSTIQIYSGTQRQPSQHGSELPSKLHIPVHNGRRSPLSSTGVSTPAAEVRDSGSDFKFPTSQTPPEAELEARRNPSREPAPQNAARAPRASHSRRVASTASHVASERSSAEFYSLSDHSQETLMSEQPSVLSDRPQISSSMMRQHYRMDPRPQAPKKPQAANLLMGYAHLNATFTLDSSLVDQSQFEEVKKKGFLGGQGGGGVVGVKKARPSSGFLGNFNFNSIGESLNNLVGGDNMSSVREMNAVTNSRAIPLLSTPQSLLFVDLHLEPGEERSYSFAYSLPRGLPSSYRGKTIKISYNILVGVQGVPGSRDVHAVRQINVPVRVFSGVDSDGEIFGHDLMQPHVVLRDLARTKSIDHAASEENLAKTATRSSGSTAEFLKFVDTLLDRNRRRQSSSGMVDAMFGATDSADGRQAVQAINRAILASNRMPTDGDSSPNRFEITRGGRRVGAIILDRPLHRLGETVTAVVDFTEGQVQCASLHSTLETAEKVSSSLAVRSAATISRITRKVYASRSENLLFSKRAVFAPSIPATATPTLTTSGINLDWSLRFEFGTIKAVELEDGEVQQNPELFEEVVKDERGIVNIAVERLACETFEVVIPITVYGDVVSDGTEGNNVIGIPL